MKITLGARQSFWRPVINDNSNDLSLYLSPVRLSLEVDWSKLDAETKKQIRSSVKARHISVDEEMTEDTEKKEIEKKEEPIIEATQPQIEIKEEEKEIEKVEKPVSKTKKPKAKK